MISIELELAVRVVATVVHPLGGGVVKLGSVLAACEAASEESGRHAR